jgi:iron(III) transport system ATP-binding protein
MAIVQLEDVTKRFGATRAVDGASLTVHSGEFLALLGPSGCGKTTLLRLITGFDSPDSGSIRIGGDRVAGDGDWRSPEQRNVGMVFQDYALFPHLTVAQNIEFGLRGSAALERGARLSEVLDLVGLSGLGSRFPHELSGGQQQRVALARALAPEPAIVCLDEPWSAIDPVLRAQLRDELAEILRRAGTTTLLVTHDQEEALAVADRIALMRDGQIVQVATPESLYHRPVDRWSAEFVGPANFLACRVKDDRAETSFGVLALRDSMPDGEFELLVRPEMVALNPDESGQGVIDLREFRGHDVRYRIRLADGTDLWSQRPSNEIVEAGAKVHVSLLGGSATVFS